MAMAKRIERALVCLLWLVVSSGCATTEVVPDAEDAERSGLARPERVLVYDFAASPDDVALNRAIPARIARRVAGDETDVKREAGRQAAAVVSNRIVDGLWSYGIPAEPADDATPLRDDDLVLTGQFVTIDEGNRIARTVIGFGTGGTEVRAHVQLYQVRGKGAQLLAGFQTIARSSRLPSLTTSVAGVTGDSVEADARRAADAIVTEILRFFIGQDWLPPDALQ
jgi:hypothetical protein